MQRLMLGLAIAFGAGSAAALAADAPKPAVVDVPAVAKQAPAKAQGAKHAPTTAPAKHAKTVPLATRPPVPTASPPKPVATKSPALPKPGAAKPATVNASGKPTAVPDHAGPQPADAPRAQAPEPPATQWSDADIAVAKARCNALLRSVDAVVMPEEPFRSGACGTPAPMRLVSMGRSPEVALSPPPVLTCEMIAALAGWVKNDVQPLARKHLGEPVIRIESMSDYSCRAAYGRKGNRLSEHGRANALDIRAFVTTKGQQATLLQDWGTTQRDIARAIATAKAAAEKAEQQRAAAVGKRPPTPVATAPSSAAPDAAPSVEGLARGAVDTVRDLARRTIVDGIPKPSADTAPALSSHSLAPPSRLGGPKDADKAAALPQPSDAIVVVSKKGRFLREAHASACRTFGTTLGPEANEAHRNHFHVDMAERKGRRFCE